MRTNQDDKTRGTAPSLMGNVGMNFLGFLAGKGAAALAGVLLMRILGPEGAGLYAGALGFAYLFAVLADFGLPGYLTRAVSQDRGAAQGMFARAVAVQAVQVAASSAVVAGAVLLGAGGQVPPALVAVAFAGAALAVAAQPVSAALQGLEEFRLVSIIFSACSWLNALVMAAVAFLFPSPLYALSGWALSNVAGLGLWLWAGRRMGLRPAWPRRPGFAGFWSGSLPFALTGVTNQLYVRQGVVLLAWMANATVLGFYGAAARLAELVQLVLFSLTGPLYPRLALLSRGITASGTLPPPAREGMGTVLTRALRYLGAACFPVAVGGSVLAGPLMTLLFGEKFAGAGTAFAWLAWAAALSGMHYALLHALNALHRARWVAGIFGFNAVLGVALNLAFIPRFGLSAVVATAVLAESLALLIGLFLVSRPCRIPVGVGRWLWPSLPAALAMGAVLLLLPPAAGAAVLGRVALGGAVYLAFLAASGFFGAEERGHLRGFLARFRPGAVPRR